MSYSIAIRLMCVWVSVSRSIAVDNSLVACQAVAKPFHNTCSKDADGQTIATNTVGDMAGQSLTKTISGNTGCPGTLSGTSCTWVRKLCVSCSVQGTTTYIRVQTNDMPSAAGLSFGSEVPSEQNIDFSVKFRPVASVNNLQIDASDQAGVDDALCSAGAFRNKPAESDFTEQAGTEAHFSTGWIALDGILGWGTSSKAADPWFPPATWDGQDLDVEKVSNCLSHPAGGVWHYHSFAPAQFVDDGSTCQMYTAVGLMNTDIRTLMFEGETGTEMDTHKSLEVVGIALDGHPVMGAHVSATINTLQGEGLDLCNGVLYDDDGDGTHDSYAYFVSKTMPYNPGCFGPANYPQFAPGCTTNKASYSESPELVAALANTATLYAVSATTAAATTAAATAAATTAAPTTAAATAAPTTAAATAAPTLAPTLAPTPALPTLVSETGEVAAEEAAAAQEAAATTAAATAAPTTAAATAAPTTAAAAAQGGRGGRNKLWAAPTESGESTYPSLTIIMAAALGAVFVVGGCVAFKICGVSKGKRSATYTAQKEEEGEWDEETATEGEENSLQ